MVTCFFHNKSSTINVVNRINPTKREINKIKVLGENTVVLGVIFVGVKVVIVVKVVLVVGVEVVVGMSAITLDDKTQVPVMASQVPPLQLRFPGTQTATLLS